MKLLAEFGAPEDATRALEALRKRGHQHIETYAPFPLTDEDAHAPHGWFTLALVAFAAGVLGLAGSYAIQWYANAESYPLNIGGRPAHAAPAFAPVMFEAICLLGALALFVGFLAAERLPRLWQPIFEIEGFERAAIDRFWIVMNLQDSSSLAELLVRELTPMHPLRIITAEDWT